MSDFVSVLYVEDEPILVQLLRSGLSLFGIEVDPVFQNGMELMASRETPQFQRAEVLVFDIRLPGMTGLELAAQLRRDGETRPLILVSAYQSPPEDQLESLNAVFISKPFNVANLADTIHRLSPKRPPSSPEADTQIKTISIDTDDETDDE